MSEVSYETLSSRKLAELAYALQIDYDPDDFDREAIIDQLYMIEKKAKLLSDEEARLLWEKQIKDKNEKARETKPCHEPVTIVTNKNTSLMSNEQLVFMPDILPDNTKIFYCLDKIEDVPYLLESRKNPFNNKPLTPEQIKFLEQSDDYDEYPRNEVGDYFDELEKQFGNKVEEYKEKEYVKKMRELFNMITGVGFPYEAEQVLNFATDLSLEQYNLFLLYKPINQKVENGLSRDDAASATLNYILNYILIQKQKGIEEGNKTIIQIGKAIDDFMYMINNKLNYQELLEARGVVEIGEVKELFWKPNFVVEEYYPGGEIKLRYYVNEEGKKDGSFITYYKNGNKQSESRYKNGKLDDLWMRWYSDGNPEAKGYYKNGMGDGLWSNWYPNKNLKSEGHFKNGDKDGVWMEYYPNGDHKSEIHHKDGRMDGLWKEWYPNGNHKFEGYVKNDRKNGIWKEWYVDGNPQSEGEFKDGNKIGVWTMWDQSGNKNIYNYGISNIREKIISAFKWYTQNQHTKDISYLFFADFIKFLNENIHDINFDDWDIKSSIIAALGEYIDPSIVTEWYSELFG